MKCIALDIAVQTVDTISARTFRRAKKQALELYVPIADVLRERRLGPHQIYGSNGTLFGLTVIRQNTLNRICRSRLYGNGLIGVTNAPAKNFLKSFLRGHYEADSNEGWRGI